MPVRAPKNGTTFEFIPADHAAIASAAKMLKARYRAFVSYEDLKQELFLWLYEHYDRAERWREDKPPHHAERTLVKALRNVGERYCRAEKAEIEGYVIDDEYFYSLPQVADMLTLYLDPDWPDMRGIDYTRYETGGVAIAPETSLIAMVADVGKRFEEMPEHDREILSEIYTDGMASDHIALKSLEWGVTYSAAYSRISRVVGRLRAALGGASPYNDRDDYNVHEEYEK